MDVTINCDLGEGFGRYTVTNDAEIMPLVDLANIACGFHASDPVTIADTVDLAVGYGVRVGAHPSLPDLVGFGRREMKLSRKEAAATVRYQIGAVKAFLDRHRVPLSHVKPHGALYGMAARDEAIAHAICDAVEGFAVPVLGLAGTAHEFVYASRGVELIPEFYADLDYGDDGMIQIGRQPQHREPRKAADRAIDALKSQTVLSNTGKSVAIRATTICVHSDSGNAVEVIREIRAALGADALRQ